MSLGRHIKFRPSSTRKSYLRPSILGRANSFLASITLAHFPRQRGNPRSRHVEVKTVDAIASLSKRMEPSDICNFSRCQTLARQNNFTVTSRSPGIGNGLAVCQATGLLPFNFPLPAVSHATSSGGNPGTGARVDVIEVSSVSQRKRTQTDSLIKQSDRNQVSTADVPTRDGRCTLRRLNRIRAQRDTFSLTKRPGFQPGWRYDRKAATTVASLLTETVSP